MVELSHARNASHARRQTQPRRPAASHRRRQAGSLRRLARSAHVARGMEAPLRRRRVDAAIKRSVPGMEKSTRFQVRHQYPPGLQARRSADAARSRGNSPPARSRRELPIGNCLPLGIPLAGLVSEPIKIVQSPGLIVDPVRIRRHASPDLHRRPRASQGSCATVLARLLGRQMGARHARGGNRRLQRQNLARFDAAIPIAKPCASWNATTAATSDTWMSK